MCEEVSKNKNKEDDKNEKFLNFKLNIIDTGAGMSEEGVKQLFVNFGKLQENAEMNKCGTGLGLSICKNIIEKMGGSVQVKSKVGKGSTFSINLKTKCIQQPTRLITSQEQFKSNLSVRKRSVPLGF